MINVILSQDQLRGALYHAQLNCGQGIGGMKSQIHASPQRRQRMGVDQATGQVAMCAVAKYLHGDADKYFTTRFFRNLDPNISDGGYDLGCANIDVKGGFMRFSSDPQDYSLLVRPREVHENWVYIHCLIHHTNEDPKTWVTTPPTITITGWAASDDLPTTPIADGPLKGALAIPVPKLNPLPPIRYDWFHHGFVAREDS
tara:strand:- start:2389 stop:2988 length:600 start_codon:yes stop_codon:yes gene_type:complete